MDKLKIIRPNGEEEIAELTTDKSLVGNNYLKLDIGGVPHYAKVGEVIDTHMYTFNGVDGKKYYIKKEIGNVENPPSGDSPTLNVSGTVTLAQMPSDIYEAFGATDGLDARPDSGLGEIVSSTSQYPVIDVMSMVLNGACLFEITMKDLYKFFEKFETPRSLSFKVTIGSLQLDMTRGEHSSIDCDILLTHFNYLKSNIGKPLNFSIKYE